jgi:hypothetical protein
MKQSPSREANSRLPSQEIPRVLQNLQVHYRVHKNSVVASVVSQMNPAHTFTSYFFNIHFTNILTSKPRSSNLSFVLTNIVNNRTVLYHKHIYHFNMILIHYLYF